MRAVIGSALFIGGYVLEAMIAWHRQHYPAMDAQDIVKAVFQALCGCGHLLTEEQAVAERIMVEEEALCPCADEPLTEPLGVSYVRLNLRRAMAEGIRPEWIAAMMLGTQSHHGRPASREDVAAALMKLPESVTGVPAAQLSLAAAPLTADPSFLPSHSDAYRAAYAPAYRVIGREYVRVLPVLSAVGAMWHRQRLLLTIDGPCGSGKTTLAGLLCPLLHAACVPMDDFFLPHGQKTAQRLSQPGGNADWERLVEEVLIPWQQGRDVVYRPYDCHLDAMASPVTLPRSKVTVLEGSYATLPVLSAYADLRVFLTLDPAEQRRRILLRDGEAGLKQFVSRWIPLEQAYFAACALPDSRCLVLDDQPDQVV